MKKKPETVASFKEIANEEYSVRSREDNRRIVNRLVIGYETNTGNEYRRRFEFERSASYQDMINQVPKQILVRE